MAKIMLMLLSGFALGPLVALTWRTRRSLAEATAVQLTRDPDGLARALRVVGGAELVDDPGRQPDRRVGQSVGERPWRGR